MAVKTPVARQRPQPRWFTRLWADRETERKRGKHREKQRETEGGMERDRDKERQRISYVPRTFWTSDSLLPGFLSTANVDLS